MQALLTYPWVGLRGWLITHIAFGFRTPSALIALAMLSLGGHKPHLPGRGHRSVEPKSLYSLPAQ